MFDPILLASALLHLGLLAGGCCYFYKRWGMDKSAAPVTIGLWLWVALVLGAQGASLLHELGSLAAYIPMTFAGAALFGAALHWAHKQPAKAPLLQAPQIYFAPLLNLKIRRALFWFLALTLGLFAAISLILALSVYPDNADSMIYRLPRAFWYVSHNSFLHPFSGPDQRLLFYPLSGIALYIPFVLYGLPGTAHALPSIAAWAAILFLTYRFARQLGADRLIALFASCLVGLTPGILAQATSTNDEIIAAAALIAGLYMLWQWALTGKHSALLLAGTAVALSASTKLHIVFLLPLIGLALVLGLWRMRGKLRENLQRIASAAGWPTTIVTILAMVALFAPFLFYNYASTGRWYFLNDFQNDVFNLGANIRISLQNLLIYFAQLTLSPIADLNIWPVANDRLAFNNALNDLFAPAIRSLLSSDASYYHLGYRFQGITLPVSVRFVEFSLWSGFVWMLWPITARLVAKQKNFPLREVFLVIALTPLLWLLLWSFATLYMEGTATYYTFYLICAAPAAAFALAHIAHPARNRLRWIIVGFVTLTNLVIAGNLVMYSGFRALPDLYYARRWPYDWLLTEQKIIDEIRAASRIRIAFTHEKMPYFGYMHWNPKATYYTPYMIDDGNLPPKPEEILQLLPISSLSIYGYMPIKVQGKRTLGVTYLGAVRAIGREAIFASGAGVQHRYPQESDYIIGRIQSTPLSNGHYELSYSEEVAGLNADDKLTFEHVLELDGKAIFHRPPQSTPAFTIETDFDVHTRPALLLTVVRDALSGKEVARTTYQVGAGNAWLPDPGDY